MKRFAALFQELDQTTKTNTKVEALAQYFRDAPDQDKLWCIALLSGRRPKRGVTTTLLREWAADAADLPLWLFEESYHIVGDLSETIALVVSRGTGSTDGSLSDWIEVSKSLGSKEIDEKRDVVTNAWATLGHREVFLFNKLITGGIRIGVNQKLMTRALSKATGIEEPALAHKLMGGWTPETTTYESLIFSNDPLADASKPYPFYLAYQLDDAPEALGDISEWSAEMKWDGIRGQLIVRNREVFLWSRGEELITDQYPEFSILPDFIADGTALDGELLVWKDDRPASFNALQARIGRKKVSKSLLADAPVVLRCYDLLEWQGKDLRNLPFQERRKKLEQFLGTLPSKLPLRQSERLEFSSWKELANLRENSRDLGAEGLMLKRLHSPYLNGRKKGDWWKWKVDPLTVDAVMIYAQAGHGRRANLFTDFTFAVWDGDTLVPFTKAYSGLTDAEFREITAWVRKNTKERFGPVRSVTPHHVFEIAFEGIAKSKRHKSGIALRFPRMARWRKDKPLSEINTLEDLHVLLESLER